MIASRPIEQDIYVSGVRQDLDQRVDEIRRLQVRLGLSKLCPACNKVKHVAYFPAYQAPICRWCDKSGMDASRYGAVSYIP